MFINLKDNTKIYLEISGEGFPLILLHGNAQSNTYFKKQIEAFQESYQVIRIDFRGHGKSTNRGNQFSLKKFSEDLKEIVDTLKIKRFDLLGFSDGANVAMYFAVNHPQMVNSLVLNSGNISINGLFWVSKAATEISILLAYLCFWQPELPKIRKLMRESLTISFADLERITAKTLVLIGQFDIIKRQHSQKIANSIPNAILKVVPWALHDIAYLQPQKFNRIVLKFLKASV
ncbi:MULTISPECIES: alpha/beta hydrolase [unclassified Enterococcus]|uniref:alpha/beta fold hydrolase n=1 Tax=unclassified Enterococcus TaxID=2608891 RepID=UPI00155781C5|nr:MULTISPECIES: alpha/beta hydrolase [unclassified Enterococcus]MBS7578116.1 alpha/beta hydrolase [Enterococcus sp. MMGLQ5-2]MBS7585376.1 alpha/beta hydrolase [Enterococcus sp. MMGLQ5-1]NPD13233.1 alpha/beta hydrolase [Enterococcus sp. MMGLQ5-1]NPD37947.1 alpha/beta hydrolase [Enterococcus sp. MMGLQ5-2]